MCWNYCDSLSGYWGNVMDEDNYKNLIGYTGSNWDEDKSKEHYRQSEYEFDVYLTFTVTIAKKSS